MNVLERKDRPSLAAHIRSYLPLAYLVLVIFAARWTLIEPYVVPTGSMEPTLKPGDRLYALKCAYDVRFPFTEWVLFRTGAVRRGDVILFRNPLDPSITFVKRAVALAGDTLDYQEGRLFINGQEVQKVPKENVALMNDITRHDQKSLYIETLDHVRHFAILDNSINAERSYQEEQMPFRHVVVPAGHVFAMGDNRDNSYDSRAWGFVPIQNLKGKAMFIWLSSFNWKLRPERIGTIIQ